MSRLADLDVQELPAAVLVCDSGGTVVEANQAASDVLGVAHRDLIGTSASASFLKVAEPGGNTVAGAMHPALTAARSRQAQRGVLLHGHRSRGEAAWVQADAVPSLNPDGTVRHVVVVLSDVTSLLGKSGAAPISSEAPSLAEITDQIADARLEPEAILATVVNALSRLRRGTWVASLISKDPGSIRVVAANEANPQLARYVEDMHLSGEAPASSIAMQVIETGRPVFLSDLPYEDFLALLRADVRTYVARKAPPTSAPVPNLTVLVVPMRSRGALVGTIGVFAASDSMPFARADVPWLQAIADRTGLAADNAQLHSDAVRRLRRLTALRHVGLAISRAPDPSLTLEVVLDHVTSGLGVDAADVLLLDQSSGSLTLAMQTGFQSTSLRDYRMAVDERLPGRVLTTHQIEWIDSGAEFSQLTRRTLFAREGFRTYCAAPLIARGRPVGVLELFHRSALDPDAEWLGFLGALSAYAAAAIDAATMSERLQKSAAGAGGTRVVGPHLTGLEPKILGLVVEGSTNAAIAEALHLSQSTVKFHVRQILQKAAAGNRTELARIATREGWI